MARHKYFQEKTLGVFSTDALIVPETAMNLRNDCKEGKWFLGETEYGSKLKFICLKFSRRIATTEYGAIAPGTPLDLLRESGWESKFKVDNSSDQIEA